MGGRQDKVSHFRQDESRVTLRLEAYWRSREQGGLDRRRRGMEGRRVESWRGVDRNGELLFTGGFQESGAGSSEPRRTVYVRQAVILRQSGPRTVMIRSDVRYSGATDSLGSSHSSGAQSGIKRWADSTDPLPPPSSSRYKYPAGVNGALVESAVTHPLRHLPARSMAPLVNG